MSDNLIPGRVIPITGEIGTPQVDGTIYTPESQIPTPSPPPKTGLGKLIESLETKKALPIKIGVFSRVYAWMNGKKSITGVLLMVAGGALCLGPGTQIAGYKMLGEGVFALGSTMLGGGLVNKVQKANDPMAGQALKTDWLSAIIAILKKILELLTKIQ
jgi:hypothetical protein